MAELLLELLSEEIPARMQERAAADLRALLTNALVEKGLLYEGARSNVTPRRLVVAVEGLAAQTRDTIEERKGPRTDAPAAAIEGFLRTAGLTREECTVVEEKKGNFYLARIPRKGRAASDLIAEIIPLIIRRFPWPRSMRWGEGSLRWVRPLHSILCTFDGEVVPLEVDGIRAGNRTRGHRFMAPGELTVRRFDDYAEALAQAKVMVDETEREELIRTEARNLAFAQGLEVASDDALVKEAAGLVEWPVVLMGEFDPGFLDLPAEVIVTALGHHQKCFALANAKSGALSNRYLLVANILARDGGAAIVAGNNRVIAARLSDAKFFWNHDLRSTLESALPKLDAVTLHAKLGTELQQARRLEASAEAIATVAFPKASASLAARAGLLAKADLASEMVGEFPELQGVMGRYYALRTETPEVASAIEHHYRPLGPKDRVPREPISIAVGLADKIDRLVGFWAIGEKPKGSGDPFALRRAALGVIRIILENELRFPLTARFESAVAQYREDLGKSFGGEFNSLDLLEFFADRLKVYLREHGARHDLIDAVFALGGEDDLLNILRRVEALGRFLDTEEGKNLMSGVKRATNIIRIEERKDGRPVSGPPDPKLYSQGEEKALAQAIVEAETPARTHVKAENFEAAMRAIAGLRSPVDAFFDKVTVNTGDPVLRQNRLRLLNRIRNATLAVADFSRIEG